MDVLYGCWGGEDGWSDECLGNATVVKVQGKKSG